MRTVVVSDLHLGARSGRDLLRQAEPRRRLSQALEGVDQLVLLGDVLELRDGRAATVLERAGPALAALGASAANARIVLVPGNHDHRLSDGLAGRAGWRRRRPQLDVQQVSRPAAGTLAAEVAHRLGAADVVCAYPGLWITENVYATHGHYLDCHTTVATVEVMAAAALARLRGGMPPERLSPTFYERALAPIYAFNDARARTIRARLPVTTASAGGSAPRPHHRADAALARPPGSGSSAKRTLLAAANRLAAGRFHLELSGPELRERNAVAMREVVRRLGIDARYVVFGHTHQPGPRDGEDWSLANGGSLVNCGSWFASSASRVDGLAAARRAGTCVIVEGGGSPRIERLLDG